MAGLVTLKSMLVPTLLTPILRLKIKPKSATKSPLTLALPAISLHITLPLMSLAPLVAATAKLAPGLILVLLAPVASLYWKTPVVAPRHLKLAVILIVVLALAILTSVILANVKPDISPTILLPLVTLAPSVAPLAAGLLLAKLVKTTTI